MPRFSLDKNTLRKQLRQQRARLSPALQKQKSASIVQRIVQSPVFKSAKHIAFYSAVQGEVDPLPLAHINHNKQYYLPILQENDQPLLFAPYSIEGECVNNRFSIPEPVHKQDQRISPDDLDVVIMPLLGFDKHRNRLGMGGGFYDRTFAFKKQKSCKPVLMGVAYDFQETPQLETESWDVPLDIIVTESQFVTA